MWRRQPKEDEEQEEEVAKKNEDMAVSVSDADVMVNLRQQQQELKQLRSNYQKAVIEKYKALELASTELNNITASSSRQLDDVKSMFSSFCYKKFGFHLAEINNELCLYPRDEKGYAHSKAKALVEKQAKFTKAKQEAEAVFDKEFEVVKEIKDFEIKEAEDAHSVEANRWNVKINALKVAIDAKRDHVATLCQVAGPRSMNVDASASSSVSSLTQEIPSQFADVATSSSSEFKAESK